MFLLAVKFGESSYATERPQFRQSLDLRNIPICTQCLQEKLGRKYLGNIDDYYAGNFQFFFG